MPSDLGQYLPSEPTSGLFGFDRGLPIDRYYIEQFIESASGDVRGNVLEIAEDTYTRRFGRGVVKCDVLHVDPAHPIATIVADLTHAPELADDSYDCIVFTQTLPFVYDVRSVVGTLQRILKPGGVVLATVPGISQISRYDASRWGDFWRFTSDSGRRLFSEAFGATNVQVEAWGSVYTAAAFLYGLAVEDLRPGELEHSQGDYELVIGIRAVKGTLKP